MYPFHKKYQVFVLGHMRSRSSLLAHILMNSKEIYGLGETNKIYKNKFDFIKMRVKTRLYNQIKIPWKFIFIDQINHNQKTPNLDLITLYSKIIILVRAPEETFESIRKLTKNFYTEWSHEQIETYYLERLQFLLALKSNTSSNQTIIINAEDLVTKSDLCLNRISDFLNLKTPLSGKYNTYKFTGKHGDPSLNINTGKIIKTDNSIYKNKISKKSILLYKEIIS